MNTSARDILKNHHFSMSVGDNDLFTFPGTQRLERFEWARSIRVNEGLLLVLIRGVHLMHVTGQVVRGYKVIKTGTCSTRLQVNRHR